jgi:hypothetical protein
VRVARRWSESSASTSLEHKWDAVGQHIIDRLNQSDPVDSFDSFIERFVARISRLVVTLPLSGASSFWCREKRIRNEGSARA